MARLLKGIPTEFENITSTGRYAHEQILSEFEQECQAYEKVEARATIWKFPMADSYAFYEVVKVQPLQLRWIPYMDKWKAPEYVIRGLKAKDIMLSSEMGRFINALSEEGFTSLRINKE